MQSVDLKGRLPVQRLVLKCNVHARLEGRVDVANSVRGEEENAIVVFELTEEDRNDRVDGELVRIPHLEKYTGTSSVSCFARTVRWRPTLLRQGEECSPSDLRVESAS